MDTRTDNETEDTFEIVADQISHKDRGERRACCGYASDWRKASGTLIESVPVQLVGRPFAYLVTLRHSLG
jgi:hypothetical protein